MISHTLSLYRSDATPARSQRGDRIVIVLAIILIADRDRNDLQRERGDGSETVWRFGLFSQAPIVVACGRMISSGDRGPLRSTDAQGLGTSGSADRGDCVSRGAASDDRHDRQRRAPLAEAGTSTLQPASS